MKPLYRTRKQLRQELDAQMVAKHELQIALTEICYWPPADPQGAALVGLERARKAYTAMVLSQS